MATKFRVGDVVRWDGRAEYRVDVVFDGMLRVTAKEGHDVCGPEEHFTLLRRPVHAGDEIRLFNGDTAVVQPEDISPGACCWANWTHADGTPIEPPVETAPAVSEESIGNRELSGEQVLSRALARDREAHWAWMQERIRDMPVARGQPVEFTGPTLPTVETLARAIFETDPRVIAFVQRVSDQTLRHPTPDGERVVWEGSRYERAMETAWQRNESDWASEAEERARQMLEVLGRDKG